MLFRYKSSNDNILENISLIQSEYEDPDLLHYICKNLMVDNPAKRFSYLAHNNGFNHLSDDEYMKLAAIIKKISDDCFLDDKGEATKLEVNIFLLVDRLMRSYVELLKEHPPVLSDVEDE